MSSKTLAPSTVTSRDPKGLKFMSIVGSAYDGAGLTDEEAQRVNDTPGLSDLVKGFIEKNRRTKQFANEEVQSNWTYPSEYKGPKPIKDQIRMIAEIFNLDPASALEFAETLSELPEGAEGWFAIPRWQAIAPTYGEAVEVTLEKLGNSRALENYCRGQLGPNYLRQSARTVQMLQEVEKTQKGDILIIAAQFGLRHRGRSVRRAREVFRANEFGCGSFIVNSMALTHPERFVRWEQLHTDHSGDEYSPGADGHFDHAPYLHWLGGGLRFGADWTDDAHDFYGAVSAFLPQQ